MKLYIVLKGLKVDRKEIGQILQIFLEEFAEKVEVAEVISEETLRLAGYIVKDAEE
jgi:hypothetical protein